MNRCNGDAQKSKREWNNHKNARRALTRIVAPDAGGEGGLALRRASTLQPRLQIIGAADVGAVDKDLRKGRRPADGA